jgi:hypothetical protein
MSDIAAAGAVAPAPSPAPAPQAGPQPAADQTPAVDKAAVAEQAHDEAMEAIWEKHQKDDDDVGKTPTARERGADGRFASKLPDKVDLSAVGQDGKPSSQPPEGKTDQPKPEAPPAESAAEAPKWWSEDLKAKFKGLPADVAKAIGEQALSDRQTISKLGNALQSYQPIGDVIARHRQEFEAVGVSPADGIGQLLSAQSKLANPATRAEAYRFLLQNYPADLGQLGADPFGLPPDPQIEAQNQRIAALEQQNRALQAQHQHRAQADEQQRYQSSLSVVDQLAAKLPHFNDVAEDVLYLVPGIRARNPSLNEEQALTQAYERAVWANPKTRSSLQKSELEKQSKAALEAAEAAKRANALNVRGRPQQSTPLNERDLDERVWNKHHAA